MAGNRRAGVRDDAYGRTLDRFGAPFTPLGAFRRRDRARTWGGRHLLGIIPRLGADVHALPLASEQTEDLHGPSLVRAGEPVGQPGVELGRLAVLTAGCAVFQTANNTAVMAEVPPDRRGVVSGALGLARNLGLVTGASVMGAVFALAAAAGDVATASPRGRCRRHPDHLRGGGGPGPPRSRRRRGRPGPVRRRPHDGPHPASGPGRGRHSSAAGDGRAATRVVKAMPAAYSVGRHWPL